MTTPSVEDFTFIKDRLEKIRKEENIVSTPVTSTDTNKATQGPAPSAQDLTDYMCCLSVDDGSVYHLHKNLANSTIEVYGTGRINANGFHLKNVVIDLTKASSRHHPMLVFVGLSPAYTSTFTYNII